MSNFEFTPFLKESLSNITSKRDGEKKIGEELNTFDEIGFENQYFILGISEDIGPQSNGGFGGSTKAFGAFLKRFVNIQSNSFLSGKNTLILGEITSNIQFTDLATGRQLVEELDLFVETILSPYIKKSMIPIVIGGGHNNAFPIIKAISKFLEKPISVINFDPHADFRPLEGRHSGNPFSYAFDQGLLNRYAILGLHQSYNSTFILNQLSQNNFLYSFFDDYLNFNADFNVDVKRFATYIQAEPFGIDLDMDSIAFMPSSAFTPSGMTVENARTYLLILAKSKNVQYLHLPEAAPKNTEEEAVVGKTLAYLVSDFIKAHQSAK